ncbi:hypothetical protein ACEWY4_026352 [Coilia grayii]|uniref:Amine oxidase domain-containing protein n=1 Tax=Coilia grayii TaxID=363190 RepID=A0ABD1IUL4_9TELE
MADGLATTLNGLLNELSGLAIPADLSLWQLALAAWVLVCFGVFYWYVFGRRSPFSVDSLRRKEPPEMNPSKRDEVLKKAFSEGRVPKGLDAVVIGSGVGGLTVAALLAKVGKKVLVLEQHEQAGGYCHSYTEKGFQFDIGLNYVGQLHDNSLDRVAFDQITEGQLDFVNLGEPFDTIYIGQGQTQRKYTIYTGKTEMEAHLKKQFPDDTEAIEKFFQVMKICARKTHHLACLKLIPRWLALFLLKTGIADLLSSVYHYSSMSHTAWLDQLTSNKDLHTIFSYFFYGVPPKDSSLYVNALLMHHYKRGAYYPKGGASEIPYHISNTIRKYGGEVLVSAPVRRILLDKNGAACGVVVGNSDSEVEVKAPIVISNCGLFNTFKNLLPPQISMKHDIQERLHRVKPGKGSFMVFCGFDATAEQLDIGPTNIRLYKDNDMNKMMDRYFNMYKEEAPDNVPMMLVTFPTAKDPTAKLRCPGKSCMTLVTMVNYEWFEEWKDMPVTKRGDQYLQYKTRFAKHMFDWACLHFPKLKEKLVFQEIYTPLSNSHFLGAYQGSMYLQHNLDLFDPVFMAKNRCDTPVKNLYLTGQDVFSCGISGALHGGLLCASSVLNHILYWDLLFLKKNLKKAKAKQDAQQAKKKLH